MLPTTRRSAPPSFFHSLPHVELRILRGRARNLTRTVSSTVFLMGAGLECDLVLGDRRFEGVHSYVLRTPERVMLRRLADSPEVTVDGQAVETAELTSGCRIGLGPYEFQVQIDWPERRIDGPQRSLHGEDSDSQRLDAESVRGVAIVGALLADIRGVFLKPQSSVVACHRDLSPPIRFRPDAA